MAPKFVVPDRLSGKRGKNDAAYCALPLGRASKRIRRDFPPSGDGIDRQH